jgi:hypothetical protein
VAKGDPDEPVGLGRMRQAIAGLPQGAILLAEDEPHLHLLPWLRSTWVLRDTRMRLPKPRHQPTPDPLRGHRAGQRASVAARATSAGFLGLPERVMAASPTAPAIAILLDHHPPLPSAPPLARGASPGPAQLRPSLLSPSPPGGTDWGAMRTELASTPVESMAGRVRQVQAFFGERSQEQGLRGALSFRSPWLPEGSAQNVWEAA